LITQGNKIVSENNIFNVRPLSQTKVRNWVKVTYGVSKMKKFCILSMILAFFFGTSIIQTQAQIPLASPVASLNIKFSRPSVSINSNAKVVYILSYSSFSSGSLFIVDSTSNSIVKEIKLNANPVSVDVNPDTNKIYITTAYSGDKVLVVDASSYEIIDTLKIQSPFGVGVHIATNKLFVTSPNSNSVTVIDGKNNKLLSTISLSSVRNPAKVVVNQSRNKVYIIGSNGIAVIDASNLKLKELSGYSSYGISDLIVDSLQNKIYFAYFNTIQTINGFTDDLESNSFEIKNTNQIAALAYSPSSHKIYALFRYIDELYELVDVFRVTSFNTDTKAFGDTLSVDDGKDLSLSRIPTSLTVIPSLETLFVTFPGKNLVNVYSFQSIATFTGTGSNNTGTSANKCPQGQELCPDGSCAIRKEECPVKTTITCPDERPVLCPDNVCVTKKEECSTTKCKTGEDLCSDGKTCVRDKSQCPSSCPSNKPHLCSEGTCVAKQEDCPVKPEFSCPPKYPFQCPNGVCVAEQKLCSKTVACPAEKPISCLDNSCVVKQEDCPPSTGNLCPSDFPVQCSNGNCVKNIEQCSEQCPQEKPFFCPDNTCTKNEQECKAKFADKCPPEKPFLCSDGITCGNKKEDCPAKTENTCPVKCQNNACVKTKEQCPVASCPSGTDLCPDGKNCVTDKSICPKNCPSGSPVLCSDGSCVVAKENCPTKTNNTCPIEKPVLCSDSSCVAKKEECKENTNSNKNIQQVLKDLNAARRNLASASSTGRVLSKRILVILTQIKQALTLKGIDCAIQIEDSVDELGLILQEVDGKTCASMQKKPSNCIPQLSANNFKIAVEKVNNALSSILDTDDNQNFLPDVCE